jgi:hypothetical protein
LSEAKAKAGFRTFNLLIQHYLEPYVDFHQGVLRKPREDPKKLLRKTMAFRERGRQLAAQPDRVRLTFNAGDKRTRRAIERLIEEKRVNASQFFCAFLERICNLPTSPV